jgi:hypothetical protein
VKSFGLKGNYPHGSGTNVAKSTSGVPHSWDVASWPSTVWPGDAKRGAWVIRSNKSELVAAGAIARVGKTRVIIGGPFVRWLERRVTRFADYQGNNPAIRQSRVI